MLTRTAAPAALITIAEAKAHLNVSHSDDDALITRLISAAMAHLDGSTGVLGRAIMSQVWAETLDGFASPLRLGIDPVSSVDNIQYWDENNVTQVMASSQYYLHRDPKGAYVKLHSGNSWPSTYSRDDAVTVTTTCGFAAGDVDDIKVAALLLVGHLYYNREAEVAGQSNELVLGFSDLIEKHRRVF